LAVNEHALRGSRGGRHDRLLDERWWDAMIIVRGAMS
jgi:hypothetical protein